MIIYTCYICYKISKSGTNNSVKPYKAPAEEKNWFLECTGLGDSCCMKWYDSIPDKTKMIFNAFIVLGFHIWGLVSDIMYIVESRHPTPGFKEIMSVFLFAPFLISGIWGIMKCLNDDK